MARDFGDIAQLFAHEVVAFQIMMGRHELAITGPLLLIGGERADDDGIEDGLF